MELSKGKDQLALLVASVKKFVWSKVLLFLESNWASFLSICEDRPDKAWRRSLICVSMDIVKFFVLPGGKSLSPFLSDSLQSYVEEILGNLCIGLKASYSDEVFSTFFRNSFASVPPFAGVCAIGNSLESTTGTTGSNSNESFSSASG